VLPDLTMKSQSRSKSSFHLSDVSFISGQLPEFLPKRPQISGLAAVVKFRQAVHKVMTHNFWNKKYQGTGQHQKTTYLGPGEKMGEKELLAFNVKSFRSDIQYD